jgi:hypothetical protein
VGWAAASAKGWRAAVVELMMRREEGRRGRPGVKREKVRIYQPRYGVHSGGRCKKNAQAGGCAKRKRLGAWAVEKHVERMETQALRRPNKRKKGSGPLPSSPAGMDTQESQRRTGSGGVGEMEWDEGRRCVPARYDGPSRRPTPADGPRLGASCLRWINGVGMKARASLSSWGLWPWKMAFVRWDSKGL